MAALSQTWPWRWGCPQAYPLVIAAACAVANPENPVKLVLNVIGVLLMIVGVVWFLQGINVLPGSFMTGQAKWAINGGIAFVVGLVLLVMSRRMRRR
jgi:type IV secretory pathway VirB6-like protein